MHIRTVIAIVIFVALVGLVMTTVFKPQERNLSRLSIPTVVPDTVEKIVLDGDETFELLKEGEQWVLDDGRLVDPKMIERALESLGSLSSTELVSSNPEKHASYEIDEEKGRRVTVFVQDQPVLDFVIGKASTLVGPYVRLVDTDDVYLAKRSPVRSYFVFARADWQRLQLFDVSLADVASLTFVSGDGNEFDLVQDEDKEWALSDTSILPDGYRFDGFRARSFVSKFLNLRANEILVMSPDPADSGLGVDGNVDMYSLSLRSGVTQSLRIGNVDENKQKNNYAQLNEDQPLLISTIVADSLLRELNDFRALNLMEFDPNNVTRLSIKSKKGRRVFEKVDGQWAVGKDSARPATDFVLNGATVERSIQTLSRIGAMSYVENAPAKAGFRKPAFEIAVTLESDETASLLLGAERKEGAYTVYYARGNVDESTYLLPEHEVAQFTTSGFDPWQ
ncbi:MAG TPA: DUF4340 domain-containing protein [Nitrospirales bacterium]|nr:DUF4340 domain-containing protein [Nitrospirales bacterium]